MWKCKRIMKKKNNNRERIIISSVGDERCLSYYWRSFLKLHNWLQVGIEACRLSDVNLWIKASSMSTWIVCLVILSATMIYSTKQVHFSLALKHFLHARIENSTEKKKPNNNTKIYSLFFFLQPVAAIQFHFKDCFIICFCVDFCRQFFFSMKINNIVRKISREVDRNRLCNRCK